jgi:adenosylcobinamide-GDP ribazoletransferase
MSTVRGAVTLLTRIPLGVVLTDGPGAAAFGLVGGLVGLVGAMPLLVLAGPLAEPWLGAIGAVAVIAVVTGAMHLDGLADTADALTARDAAAAERARKDPSLGPAGVVAIALVLAGEIAALGSLTGTVGSVVAGCVLVAVAATSRILPAVATRLAGHVLTDGLGGWFAQRVTTTGALIAASSAGILVLGSAWLAAADGWVVAIAAGATVVLGGAVAAAVVARRGGLDGDGMGTIVELSVLAGLTSAALVAV